MNNPVGKKCFAQINIVVADIETAAEKWADFFGIEKPEIRIDHLEGGDDTDRTIGIYPGSSWTIVDTEDTLGVNLNIKPVR